MTREQALTLIKAERARAILKHGEFAICRPGVSDWVRLGVISEELGEVYRSMLDTGAPDRAEVVQLAGACLAMLETMS